MGLFGGSSSLTGGYSAGKSKTKGSSSTRTTLLDADTLAALKSQALKGVPAYEGLINNEDARMTGALDTLSSLTSGKALDVDAIMAAAKQDSDRAIGQSYQNLVRSVGAPDNSLVQMAQAAENVDAATQLAGKRAELEALNATQQAQAAQILLGSLGDKDKNKLNALNSLLSIYRGADTTEKGTSTNKTSSSSFSIAGSAENK